MSLIGYALLWFGFTFALYRFVRRGTEHLPPVHLGRVLPRAIFGAIAFTPTLVGGPWAAFPAPASLVLALGILTALMPEWVVNWMGEPPAGQTQLALAMFGITSLVWFYAICGGPKANPETAEGDQQNGQGT